jgi:hypothetical protein
MLLLFALLHCCASMGQAQACSVGFTFCSPSGATTRDVPEIGPGMERFYLSMVATIDAQTPQNTSTTPHPEPGDLIRKRESPKELCC